ncbi:MAG: glycoside hydrolase family 127 protein, partial [Spirochaetales bacterium]|nr:glycoside hydrolase family 127 protein [Spirochaetales bacterium]
MIPHMWEILQNKELCHSWENFLIAAGEAEGEHSGPPFHDGDFYKWLEAASRLYGSRDDSYWNILLDSIIELIGRVQRKDGYIFTYDAIMKRNKGRSEALDNDLNFEVYNMGHLMSAGCVHYAQTGKRALLDMGEKAADYLSGQFSTLDSARTAICPSHYMGLAQLYRATSDEKYLDLLEDLMALRDSVPEGTDDNQDRIPLKKHREIVGHAVRANYLYAGLCDLYNERDDKAYREVLESVWTDLTTRKLYITGGCGALYDGVSPYGCDEYDYIQRTHQSYGRPYELPNSNGYNETCGAIGFYLWNYRMAVSLNEGKYGDEMEKALYNSVFSGISIAGDRYFYTNALRCLDHQPQPLKWFRHRAEYLTSFCCPPNVLRTIAETSDMMCTNLNDGLAILLYGEAEIQVNLNNDTSCRLKIHTDYPWSGNIRITVQESPEEAGFPVYLRIPSWAESHTTRVNGTNTAEPVERGFIRIFKTWQPGDEIILDLPMDAVLL